jgi:hypothetical protein
MVKSVQELQKGSGTLKPKKSGIFNSSKNSSGSVSEKKYKTKKPM